MSLNKYGESQKESLEKIAEDLSALSHEEIIVEARKDGHSHIDVGGGGPGVGGRDRTDTGH